MATAPHQQLSLPLPSPRPWRPSRQEDMATRVLDRAHSPWERKSVSSACCAAALDAMDLPLLWFSPLVKVLTIIGSTFLVYLNKLTQGGHPQAQLHGALLQRQGQQQQDFVDTAEDNGFI